MAGSWKRIDYRLRLAKNVERRMMSEALRRLTPFGLLDSYRYIGMGSMYFSDFSLFHKSLGVTEMVSIEDQNDLTIRRRFKLNSPFCGIDVQFGHSSTCLSALNWHQRSIVWMDYDGSLDSSVLLDVDLLCAKLCTGSFLAISVNAASPKPANAETKAEDSEDLPTPRKNIVEDLKDRLGAESVPYDLKPSDLSGWGTAKVYKGILEERIRRALTTRNAALSPSSHLHFKQVFNFHYDDGTRMLTLGGVIVEKSQLHVFDSCAFGQLPYCSYTDEPYLIEIPQLTFREMGELDRHGPGPVQADADDNPNPTVACIPEKERAKYFKTYRFFPPFIQSELT